MIYDSANDTFIKETDEVVTFVPESNIAISAIYLESDTLSLMINDSANDTFIKETDEVVTFVPESNIAISAIYLESDTLSLSYGNEDTVVTENESISVPRFTSFTLGRQFWGA